MLKKSYFMMLFILAALLFGCQNQSTEPNLDLIEKEAPIKSNDPIQITDRIPPSQQEPVTSIIDKNNDTQISSSKDSNLDEAVEPVEEAAEGVEPEVEKTPDPEPEPDIVIPYNPSNPTLMGLTIKQSKDKIKQKFGIPNSEYVMEDPRDPITVYEYTGFQIGYNKQNQIVFIDINSNQIDPGLNGLKLGDTVEAAVIALGNPDTRTDYVLNYKSVETNLKLDIDPYSNTISSIKLFGIN